jgi:hypothetical protein
MFLLSLLAASSATETYFSRAIVYELADRFAAHELRRYILKTTGSLAQLVDATNADDLAVTLQTANETLVLATSDGKLFTDLSVHLSPPDQECILADTNSIRNNEHSGVHMIKTLIESSDHGRIHVLVGNDPTSVLYSVYTAAEKLGVRFELAGDVLPDPTNGGLPLSSCKSQTLPAIETPVATPTFDYRGLQPFHDFPEGE